jgi:hypothetical protein
MPTYDWRCPGCSFEEEAYVESWKSPRPCSECQVLMEKVWSTASEHRSGGGYPYKTKNITGKLIEVQSPSHEKQLCREHGVTKRDDAAWLWQEFEGVDMRTGKQKYREGNGVGMPGCWI